MTLNITNNYVINNQNIDSNLNTNSNFNIDCNLTIDYEAIITKVVQSALEIENFEFDIELNVILTNNNEIQKINKEFRQIDKPTDVLSFPQIDYVTPADFSQIRGNQFYYGNPDTGEILLGDIIISLDKVFEQAEEYGHSTTRELAFLVAHSMLHLFGYDHMEPEEDKIMQDHQEKILSAFER